LLHDNASAGDSSIPYDQMISSSLLEEIYIDQRYDKISRTYPKEIAQVPRQVHPNDT
jgi:hypothetical protein